MGDTVRVARELRFEGGPSAHKKNVDGRVKEIWKHDHDDFMGDTLSTDRWATSVPGTGDSIAISEVAGGECLITSGSVDDDSCMMATAIIFNGTKEAECEFRVTIDDVSQQGLFVGFSDAKSEANGSVAIHYPADSLTTVATDAVGFVIDADHATSSIMCASVIADVDTTPVDTAVDWADAEARDLRVSIDTSGNATFYINGAVVARIASAVTTATLLCATVQAITRANPGTTETTQVRRYDSWVKET